jgi:hypothetical protein
MYNRNKFKFKLLLRKMLWLLTIAYFFVRFRSHVKKLNVIQKSFNKLSDCLFLFRANFFISIWLITKAGPINQTEKTLLCNLTLMLTYIKRSYE